MNLKQSGSFMINNYKILICIINTYCQSDLWSCALSTHKWPDTHCRFICLNFICFFLLYFRYFSKLLHIYLLYLFSSRFISYFIPWSQVKQERFQNESHYTKYMVHLELTNTIHVFSNSNHVSVQKNCVMNMYYVKLEQ